MFTYKLTPTKIYQIRQKELKYIHGARSYGDSHEEFIQILGTKRGMSYRNLYIQNQNNIAEIDNIIITNKAIYVIEAKSYNGIVTPNQKTGRWMHYGTQRITSFYSPTLQNKTHCDMLKKAMQTLQLKGAIPIISIVVFDVILDDAQWLQEMPKIDNATVILLSNLLQYIDKSERQIKNIISKEDLNKICALCENAHNASMQIKKEHLLQAEIKNMQAMSKQKY